ncbi:uncharacterized protein LOC108164873 [Drosophila miranda]|uniref:uncharacterized protein LOC108164873 n=1 Tax=Drosophila miranda TaxID=7229 RepID=UPI0007E70997|nr:uncharacterized protein LOC108164873 [Drosophila miranda]
MKLRSQSYREMVKILKDAGVYEEGMQTSELKKLAQAVEMSTMEQIEANQEKQQFESARNEGELEVNSSHPVERQTVRERSADGNSRVLRSHSKRVQTNNKNNTNSSN